MKKALTALFILLLAVSVTAQVRTGNIMGKVVDSEGNSLPGVSVTITSQFFKQMMTVTSAEGMFRFLSLPSASDYGIKLELTGFKTRTETGIIVQIGANVNLTLTMEQGGLEEQVTVTARTPVVDAKKTSVGANVTQDILQGLPTARDPWVILQMAPSIMVDRENVGGAESGQQSNYVARGANSYNNNVWAMDGIVITDPAAIGASPAYYDFDAFEEMQITVGGADVTVQTGGIALNMVTRRGGNKMSLGGRFYFIDSQFQAANANAVADIKAVENPTNLTNLFQGINRINTNKDYGFNLGLPLVKDKAWFWFSYGIQDIKTRTIFATADDTLLENYVAKLNLQIIPQNRFEVFFTVGGKKKWGRDYSSTNPEGRYQQGRYHFGSPILKLQDEHMIGTDIFLSFKFAYSDAGFSLTPMTDLAFNQVRTWDVTAQRYYGSQAYRYYVERPVYQYNFMGSYFKDNLFGASHEFKIGAEYASRKQYVESVASGNLQVNRNYRLTDSIWDVTGDGTPDLLSAFPSADRSKIKYFGFWRGYYRTQFVKALGLFASDTITFGRFNILLGLRYDWQQPHNAPFTINAMDGGGAWQTIAETNVQTALNTLLPGLELPERYVTTIDSSGSLARSKYSWEVFSPRIGFTWDVTGDGKTIAKFNVAQYGDFMGTATAERADPGGVGGWMDFWWFDGRAADGTIGAADNKVQLSELGWLSRRAAPFYQFTPVFNTSGAFVGNWTDAASYYWGGFDQTNPTGYVDPYTSNQDNVGSSRTSEAMLTLEREIVPDFAVSVVGTYRKYDKFNWTKKYWLNPDGTRTYATTTANYPSRGLPEASYYNSTLDPDTVFIADTKEAQNHDWYSANTAYNVYSPYTERQTRTNYYMDYFGLDLIFNKRLTNKWMLTGNFTWQWQAQHYGEGSVLNPLNVWAYDGKPQAAYIGSASGKINQYTYSRWMFKVAGLYQLPFGLDVSGTFNMREGWVQDEYFNLTDYRLPATDSRSADIRMDYFGTQRLPLFYNFSFRVEKMLKLGDTGRIYVMLDIFNVLNKLVENRRNQKNWGAIRVYGQTADPTQIDWTRTTFTPEITNNALNEVLNPRVSRIGVRFQF